MAEPLYTIDTDSLRTLQDVDKQHALASLESGCVIYLPNYSFKFEPEDQILLTESILDGMHKNVSYDYCRQRLSGFTALNQPHNLPVVMHQFMHRFAEYAKQLLDALLPHYSAAVHWGRTSYRPAEIKNRKSSKRKDDTRLHVDSFPATPVNGWRILRVFCNVNPYGEPRVWHVGEPFAEVMEKFAPRIPPYNRTRAKLLKLVKATKTLRSPYDHYMLHLHDRMKLDDHYQQTLDKQRIEFPPNSTWLVFTDHVSHAALSGQYLLEQTFYLPADAMAEPALSPLRQWERKKSRALV